MHSHVTLRSSRRIAIALAVCAALLPVSQLSLLVNGKAQGQRAEHAAWPRQSKPEGTWPNLDDVQAESQTEREPPAPIPSTVRSHKNPLQPWNGRRVGDPAPEEKLDHPGEQRPIHRAHARKRFNPPPTILDDQFVQNFFTWAVLRPPNANELTFWNDQFRVAYGQGQMSLQLVAIALGKTLFESAEYANRNRDNHWFVYDLYETFLMRDPDASGWAYWESVVPPNGRENVRRAFEVCSELAGILASMVPNGSATANAASLVSARIDPRNQPGHGMLARDVNWSVPLLSLPGRNGLDLGLALSYSSQVWTRSGPNIHFDEDNGFPSPGFRLAFPVIQRKLFDAQTAKNVFLMVTPSGQRVELRQVGSSNIYEAGDSSYLQLTDNSPYLLVRSTDGTQLFFVEINNEYSCIQVKDRNGNYITINNNSLGRIATITDTLGRVINFNYDSNANLISITQAWNGQPSHQWVSFGWSTRTMQSSFSGVAVVGTVNGAVLPVITQVALNDTSFYTFDYNNSLQVSVIRNYFGTMERNATTFTYETPAGDVPRLIDSRLSGYNWTGLNGVPSQVITQYGVASDGACVLTAPDGTVYKEYYGTGWQKGLTTLSEVWSGGVRQKATTIAWTQDNTSVGYKTNPRVIETNIYDASGNRRRTVIDYGPYAQYGLPYLVKEYAADGGTEIRYTYTDYNLSQPYLDQRIIGLISAVHLTAGSSWQGKVVYEYDDPARLQALPVGPTQHDVNYNASFTARGNVTAVSQWDFTDIVNYSKRLTTYTNYSTTGSPISTTDPAGHTSRIAYADSYSDGVNHYTFAYPTTITDADGFSSYVQYNYDFGAATRTQSPAPAGQSQGTIQTMNYNSLGQLERVTNTNNGAYKRFWYGPDHTASYTTVNNVADEVFAVEVRDGIGRPILNTASHPGSTGGYRTVNTIYDQMGRAWKQSNPTEVTALFVPSGDDAAGIYYTQQSYDWKGRPLVTTNPDGTTKEASYAGCGCAGGEVVTLTDEGTIDGGVAKRRQQRIYSDVFGRTVKTEILNWQGGSVYSTTVNTYNVRDQITQVREYAGTEASGSYQTTTLTYDGYGRLKTKHVPEQDAGSNTIWDYNTDGTIQKTTDGRGAVTNYAYNSRHLLTGVSYSVPSGSQIPVPAAVTYAYDAASNRTSMTDGTGATNYGYDSLSRMTSESRNFTGFSGTYTLNYSYNLADSLTALSIPFRSQQIGYTYDSANRLSGVTASGFTAYYYPYSQNVSSFASNISYRAWGGRKSMTYGNTTSEQITYNSRMQPTTYTLSNMNYQNTNVCCSYPTYSTMSWSYGYYADGRVEHAWDSTNDWFDRRYKYDQVGRVTEASTYRRARGLSPFPAVPYRDPYYQSISYDVWNHSSRTGLFYTAEPSDIGRYTNNRREGWQYDTDGNTTWDASYGHKFDAAGADTQSVSHAMISYGFPSPLPQVDITQTYDGADRPGKRVQISRQPAEMDEWGNEWPAVEDTQTTYYVRSSVLGGAAIVELNSGSIDTVNIYAGGQRIARQISDNVIFEHHNPVTGSWVTSLGHSSYRTTNREERDVRGGEVPTSNPYAWAEGYSDWKFGSPLYIEGGDPSDYSSGRSIDGLPVSEAEFQRRVGKDVGIGTFVNGKSAGFVSLTDRTFLSRVAVTFDVFKPPLELSNHPELWGDYYDHSFDDDVDLAGSQATLKQHASKPQQAGFNMQEITRRVNQVLSNPDCATFYQRILNSASRKNPPLDNGNMLDIFRRFLAQPKGGLTRKKPKDNAGFGGIFGRLTDGNAKIFSPDFGSDVRDFLDTQTTLAELMHLAGSQAFYSDYDLAVAAHNIPEYEKQFNLSASSNVFGSSYLQMKNGKVIGKGEPKDKNDGGYSTYIHTIERIICPVPKK